MAEKTIRSRLYNHVAPSLSELDLEMIRAIPPGGNWKDIPAETAVKSARVSRIRRTGGRTTYYGRLRPDMPSYTINTYFHRPGNGTFIHYSQDRTISLREAARLQSFPDDYMFLGSLTSVCRQIGNAVPPLLARAIGKSLGQGPAVDLFAGAGGLSYGLQSAGIDVLVAAEFNPTMCSTYRFNHPGTDVLCADLSEPKGQDLLLESVEETLRGRTLQVLAGGPPCQGFSTAGHWNYLDSRNQLVDVMLRVTKVLQPEQVLIENVQGIRWMADGHFFSRIIDTLSEMGYSTSYAVLKAEQYGVPQRRRRVFIVGRRDGDCWTPPAPLFAAVPRGARSLDALAGSDLPLPVTVREAIDDLPPLEPGTGSHETFYDPTWPVEDYQRLMRGSITFDEFLSRR